MTASDEVYCQEPPPVPEESSWSMSNLPVILTVVVFLLAILGGLAFALRRFSHNDEKVTMTLSSSSRQVRHRDRLLLGRDRDLMEIVMEDHNEPFSPSCPPLSLPPPYTSLPQPGQLPRPPHPLPAPASLPRYSNPPPGYDI